MFNISPLSWPLYIFFETISLQLVYQVCCKNNKPCLVIFEPFYLLYFQSWLLFTFHGNILILLKDYTRLCHILAYLALCAFISNIQVIFIIITFLCSPVQLDCQICFLNI